MSDDKVISLVEARAKATPREHFLAWVKPNSDLFAATSKSQAAVDMCMEIDTFFLQQFDQLGTIDVLTPWIYWPTDIVEPLYTLQAQHVPDFVQSPVFDKAVTVCACHYGSRYWDARREQAFNPY